MLQAGFPYFQFKYRYGNLIQIRVGFSDELCLIHLYLKWEVQSIKNASTTSFGSANQDYSLSELSVFIVK